MYIVSVRTLFGGLSFFGDFYLQPLALAASLCLDTSTTSAWSGLPLATACTDDEASPLLLYTQFKPMSIITPCTLARSKVMVASICHRCLFVCLSAQNPLDPCCSISALFLPDTLYKHIKPCIWYHCRQHPDTWPCVMYNVRRQINVCGVHYSTDNSLFPSSWKHMHSYVGVWGMCSTEL